MRSNSNLSPLKPRMLLVQRPSVEAEGSSLQRPHRSLGAGGRGDRLELENSM